MNKHNLNIDKDNQNINNDDQNAYVEGDFGEVSDDGNINYEGVDVGNSGDDHIDDECVDYDNSDANVNVTPSKWVAAEYDVPGALLQRRVKESFKTDTLDFIN
nr:hypothetical protein [Tanacetum cinerariifolium]